jgi:hypothetical protein
MTQLEMKAAQRSFARTRMIILYEYIRESCRCESLLIVAFEEEAAGVTKDLRAKLPYLGKRCGKFLQTDDLSSEDKFNSDKS